MAELETLSLPVEVVEALGKETAEREGWTAAEEGAEPRGFSCAVLQANRLRRAKSANVSARARPLCAPVAEVGSAAAVAPAAAEVATAAAAVAASATAAAAFASAALLLESPPGSNS